MKIAFGVLLVIHGLIHLMGFVKAFGFADLPQLTQPISRPVGVLWLLATLAMLAAATTLFASPRVFYLVGGVAVVLSQALVVMSFRDAKIGTLANVIALAGVVYGFASQGPTSFRAEYEAEVARGVARGGDRSVVTEQDLAHLPRLVARYLKFVGVVGHPRVAHFRVRFSGQIRGGPNDPWMPFLADQTSFAAPATRLFLMEATMMHLPVAALHEYVDGAASMRVKVVSLVPMVDAKGPAFTQTETVTLFNDMCIMAPAMLVDANVRWREVDDHHVEGTLTNAGHTISAVLEFDDEGRLTDFVSDDRPALAKDNVTFTPSRWSTPVSAYRAFGPFRLAAHGEARYRNATGDYAYGQFELLEVHYDQ